MLKMFLQEKKDSFGYDLLIWKRYFASVWKLEIQNFLNHSGINY